MHIWGNKEPHSKMVSLEIHSALCIYLFIFLFLLLIACMCVRNNLSFLRWIKMYIYNILLANCYFRSSVQLIIRGLLETAQLAQYYTKFFVIHYVTTGAGISYSYFNHCQFPELHQNDNIEENYAKIICKFYDVVFILKSKLSFLIVSTPIIKLKRIALHVTMKASLQCVYTRIIPKTRSRNAYRGKPVCLWTWSDLFRIESIAAVGWWKRCNTE